MPERRLIQPFDSRLLHLQNLPKGNNKGVMILHELQVRIVRFYFYEHRKQILLPFLHTSKDFAIVSVFLYDAIEFPVRRLHPER